MTIAVGTRFGRYEIRSKIGKGGMGEVYLAQDTDLERSVAVKLLPADAAADQQALRRFVQEAKTASALNHPNILTIHEIGREDDVRFIATEFIDGETLRQWMRNAPLRLGEVLDVAVQIASALSAAHAAGIIHRDIKPENIMRRRDGIVKILDFGLSKLREKNDTGEVDADAVTKALLRTEPGAIMGTVAYMSPEQVRGFAIDARTDIFSLGIVIYEMVTGQAPFVGNTRSDLIVSLLDREPLPLSHFAPEAPDELERVVMKALAKDRDERYQTTKDLLIDLRRLEQKLRVNAEIERTAQTGLAVVRGKAAASGDRLASTAPGETPQTPLEGSRATSGSGYVATEIKRHQKVAAIIFAALVVVLVYGLYRFASQKKPAASATLKMLRLSSTGKVLTGSISPDGKQVVYVVEDAGKQSIWLKQIATLSDVQIVAPAELTYSNFSFTRDGNYIYYNKSERDGPDSLYQMTAFGGMARKIAENVASRVVLSSDEKRIAFIRGGSFANENSLIVASSDGRDERVVATRKSPEKFSLGGVAWAPDGKSITFVAGVHNEKLFEIPVGGGAEKLVTTPKWFTLTNIEWLPDASGLIVIAREQTRASPSQIWYLSYPSGEARRLTPDFSNYANLSLTGDANTLVVIKQETTSHIWVAPDGDASRAKQLTTGTGRQDGNPAVNWTPDGKIIYDSTASGSRHPWIMNADGSDQRQLMDGSYEDRGVHVSHDGRHIVFTSNRTGTYHIYRMDIDGNNLKQVTNGPGEISPRFSPDGQWVICDSLTNRSWKVPADGGELVQLTDGWASDMSPDGKLITYVRHAETSPLLWNITIVPFEGGTPLKRFDLTSDSRPNFRWTPDGRAVVYNLTHGGVLAGVTNLWIRSLEGDTPKQLTNFTSETFFSFDWSRDGKWLAYGRGTTTSDVVLISDFR